ncbi:MAG: Co2+/Mg2+ efflux protein ApaG [Candidatus Marinimicrobia bacterium]|nr:Co2+/Mg2+ efflux protein ApaG [Candidatus Neomarinimicrobiota bacterium]MBL7031213.1 Co2+/Mg2+ efflux protein ApaG [Candidatus Neomarinimicrobiota bacterium]
MTETKTNQITIAVQPNYIPERSDPSRPVFFFAYHITITNEGNEPVKLKNRYWHITDGNGNIEEVRGPGVVGNQPYLKSGESFEYTSFCPLATEFGVMHGHFEMVYDNGKKFNAKISPFRLTVPYSVN